LIDGSKNGAVVGTVYKDMKGPLFPTVAVHSQNEEYVVHFFKKVYAPSVIILFAWAVYCEIQTVQISICSLELIPASRD
jgi:hypothetical protein